MLSGHEVTKEDVLIILQIPIQVEVLCEVLVGKLTELLSIFIVDETVSEDSVSLTHVKLDEVLLGLYVLVLAHQHSLNNLAQVTQVECVMTLGWGWQEGIARFGVDLDSRFDDLVRLLTQVDLCVLTHISLQDRGENHSHGG